MARLVNRLTARTVETITEPGLHADGGGLYLSTTNGGRRWLFLFRWKGKRREMGLGSATNVPLARAREMAANYRALVADGRNPIEVRESERVTVREESPRRSAVTFGEFADRYIAEIESEWRSPVHLAQWKQTLRQHAASIRDKPIVDIGTEDVLAVLRPLWATKCETASRLRGRIERILDAARARGLRPRDSMNPAQYKGHLALLLPKRKRLQRGHHPALPFEQVPAFMQEVRSREALAARCLEFVILTAARSGEALGATWREIDFAKRLWTVPADRMKAGAEHVVPLSAPAIALLEKLRPANAKPDAIIFAVGGAARSNMAMTMLLRRMGRSDITTHGFRSTFRDWAGDATSFPRELIEQALAHTIQNKAERAYRRGTAIERRRALMDQWATYLDSAPPQAVKDEFDALLDVAA